MTKKIYFLTTKNETLNQSKNSKRKHWKIEEEKHLRLLISQHGTKNWALIANFLNNKFPELLRKNSRQCKDRWRYKIKGIEEGQKEWTEEEDRILFESQEKLGNKWLQIAKLLPGRNENTLKNHYYSKIRKYVRKVLKNLKSSKFFQQNGLNKSQFNIVKIQEILKTRNISYSKFSLELFKELILNHHLECSTKTIKTRGSESYEENTSEINQTQSQNASVILRNNKDYFNAGNLDINANSNKNVSNSFNKISKSNKSNFLSNAGLETDVFDSKNLSSNVSNKAENEKINFISDENSEINELECANKFLEKLNSNVNNLSCVKDNSHFLPTNSASQLLASFAFINNSNNHSLQSNLEENSNNNNLNVNINSNSNDKSALKQYLSQLYSFKNVINNNNNYFSNINNYNTNITTNFNNNINNLNYNSICNSDYSTLKEKSNFVYNNNINTNNHESLFGLLSVREDIFNGNYYANDFENLLLKQNLFIEKLKMENNSYLNHLISILHSD